VNFAGSIANILVALTGGGAIVAVINSLFARRRSTAEAESIEADTATKLLKSVTEELARLQQRLANLETQFANSETARMRAEELAHREQLNNIELKGHIASLQRAYAATRARVNYLTEVVRQSGQDVSNWTPPSGYDQANERQD
jgi:chromosome segregation ATPase